MDEEKTHLGPDMERMGQRPPFRDSDPEDGRTIGSLMKGARIIYLAGGWLFAGLAFLGVLLPLLPTTPFLLLAGTCFSRSSPRLHDRILNMPVFGEYLRQWDTSHTVPRQAKQRAWMLIAASFALSAYLVESTGLRLMLVVLGFGLGCLVALLPEKESDWIPSQDQKSARTEAGADDACDSTLTEVSEADQSDGEPTISDQSSPNRSRLPSR